MSTQKTEIKIVDFLKIDPNKITFGKLKDKKIPIFYEGEKLYVQSKFPNKCESIENFEQLDSCEEKLFEINCGKDYLKKPKN